MAPALERAGLHLLKEFRWGDLMLKAQKEMATKRNRWIALIRGGRGSPTGIYFDRFEQGVEGLVRTVRSWKPDILVMDLLFHPGVVAAEACGLPYATLCPIILPLPSASLPPYGFGLSPREAPDWRWYMGKLALRLLNLSADRVINRARKRYGLPAIRGSFFYSSPYLFIAFTTEAFEYARPDLPRQVFYVGPATPVLRGDTEVAFPWEWLDGRPLVYTSLGTINTGQTQFFDKSIEASRGQPWQMVISVGRHLALDRWKNVPENVLLRNYVPQAALLRRTQAVISHGGANTVHEALAAGIPLAAVPIGADHFESAQRVVEAGAGLRLKLGRLSVDGLRETVRRLLDDGSLRKNAQRIAADFAKCDGPTTAAALLLKLAEKRASLSRRPDRGPTIYASQLDEILGAV
jgi:MGT family glycosyltransferase